MERIGRGPQTSTRTYVQTLRFPIGRADEPHVRSPGRGMNDKEVIQVKARLYRTAFVVSVVAVLLEGLGAGFKWG
jgi:hypothetical protein